LPKKRRETDEGTTFFRGGGETPFSLKRGRKSEVSPTNKEGALRLIFGEGGGLLSLFRKSFIVQQKELKGDLSLKKKEGESDYPH